MTTSSVRAIGVTVLGLFCGLLVGVTVTEVVARLTVDDRGELPDSLPLALLLGFAPVVLAAAGAVVAVLVDRRLRR